MKRMAEVTAGFEEEVTLVLDEGCRDLGSGRKNGSN